eukprot:CAMPEP_0170388472 /NCGR_PEP_ID=MMETSP0117_2-20130122/18102_1 /TAXON_ID=400756 /ORGANISM="Durinskia baltica, Strain CSIRO CS-38" /LENGTH=120 /DNA_ID=CAMNT_0010644395 /DNA_START=85 /DNA_END=447 /DNA_ORIENTATION=+
MVNQAMFSTERITGRVKFYNTEKGFGFIAPDNGTEDVFVHFSAVQSDGYKGLMDEEEVEFTVVFDEIKNKSSAREVTGVNGAQLMCQKPRESRGSSNGRSQGGGRGHGNRSQGRRDRGSF